MHYRVAINHSAVCLRRPSWVRKCRMVSVNTLRVLCVCVCLHTYTCESLSCIHASLHCSHGCNTSTMPTLRSYTPHTQRVRRSSVIDYTIFHILTSLSAELDQLVLMVLRLGRLLDGVLVELVRPLRAGSVCPSEGGCVSLVALQDFNFL